MKLQAPRGMADLLKESAVYRRLENAFWQIAKNFNFKEIRTPVLENKLLFVRSVGETSDIVSKEMFEVIDGDSTYVLRPEGTAPVIRALVENGLSDKPQKLAYWAPMFRKERPQKGRLRQFYQYGWENIGCDSPGAEAESLVLIKEFYISLGLTGFEFKVNYLGSKEDRENFRKAFVEFLTPRALELSEESQKRLLTNPLRILDSKEEKDKALVAAAPKLQDFLSDKSRLEFEDIKTLLVANGISFTESSSLVRGLDYYTGFVFEVVDTTGNLGSQSALGGGGRYDGLAQELGGASLPAFGFAGGVERLLLALNLPDEVDTLNWYFMPTSPESLALMNTWKKEALTKGLSVELDYNIAASFKKRFKRADKLKAKKVLILGEQEWQSKTVKVKDLTTGNEVVIDLDKFSV